MAKKKTETTALADLLTEDALLEYAGERSYDRGMEYYQDNQVTGLSEYRGKIIATVAGTRQYDVRLWEESGRLEWSCTCPVGESGDFCKHCVAVGLAWLEENESGQFSAEEKVKPETTLDDVEKYFSGLTKENLVETLMELVSSDDEIRERYILEAARHKSGGPDFAAYHAALEHALKITGYISYQDAWDYIWRVQSVVEMLEGFFEDGYAAEVRDLAEFALNLMGQSYGKVDDSDGEFGETIQFTLELHHRACELSPPNPEALARTIFEWDMNDDFDVFEDLTDEYAELLGEKGKALYRRLAQEEWGKVSAAKPGKDRSYSESDGRRYRITSIMESFARSSGNIEELVAIKSRDLSKPYNYLEIAKIFRDNGQYDRALEWVEKGIGAFPGYPDQGLQDFLVEEYHRRGRYDDEMRIIWERYASYPTLPRYRELRQHAVQTGSRDIWRNTAVQFIRKKLEQERKTRENSAWNKGAPLAGCDLLVQIFLEEENQDEAWDEAKRGGCSPELWLKMAEMRKDTHPEDTLAIWRQHVEVTLRSTGKHAYEESVKYMLKINDLMHRRGEDEEFRRYLEEFRKKFKTRKAFIALLDSTKWK